MDNQYGRPAESVRRFSFIKWSVAGLLLAVLLLTWLARPDPPANAPAIAADAARSAGEQPASATARGAAGARGGAPTSLAIELAGDGSLKVHGMVADESTRNQWLNEIRVGAQSARVTDELRVGAVSPAASGWAGQLSGLVALMRERRLAGLRVDGDRVLLKGAVGNTADKVEIEKMIQAQLPPGFRLESQLAVGSLAAGTPTGAAGSTAGSAGAAGAAGGAASAPAPDSSQKYVRGGDSAAAAAPRADTDKLAQGSAARSSVEAGSRKPARAPANCPRQLRSLAQPVYFDTDAATIAADDRGRLLRLGACLGRARLRIVGHADPRHTDEYNQQLSERRARAVADALVEGGASASRISVVGAGKARPTARGVSQQALQRSRRVDIQIR